MAMLMVKRKEKAPRIRFSDVVKEDNLKCPRSKSRVHPTVTQPVCSAVRSQGNRNWTAYLDLDVPCVRAGPSHLLENRLVEDDQHEVEEEVDAEIDELCQCGDRVFMSTRDVQVWLQPLGFDVRTVAVVLL